MICMSEPISLILDDGRNIAIIVGTIITLLTLIKGVYEYTRQVAQKRSEQYAEMRKRFRESKTFPKLLDLLEENDPKLAKLPWSEKVELLGFYEDVALMVYSGIMKRHVAFYMFAYYALRCWDSEYFWHDVNRNSSYWSLFRHFVEDMKAIEDSFVFRIKNYRL